MSAPVEPRLAAEEPVGDHLGHRRSTARPGRRGGRRPGRTRRSRRSPGSAGTAGAVDDDAAALARPPGPPRGPARRAAGCPAENTTTSASMTVVAGERAPPPGSTRSSPAPVCTSSPSVLDVAAQHRAAALVDLPRHQPRRELDDVRAQAEARERVARPPGRAARRRRRPRSRPAAARARRRVQVVDGPVDEAAGLVARHRRHERRGAGGQHQRVVGDGRARPPVVTVRAARSIAVTGRRCARSRRRRAPG